jgi:hypothetical protein
LRPDRSRSAVRSPTGSPAPLPPLRDFLVVGGRCREGRARVRRLLSARTRPARQTRTPNSNGPTVVIFSYRTLAPV